MSGDDVAIIAMTGRFRNAASVAELWRALCEGRELITYFSRDELAAAGVPAAELDHPDYVRARGVLRDADLFDADFFGYSPREAELIDPQQRLFLECAWAAAEEAGYVLSEHPGRIGVFAAAPASTYPALGDAGNPLLVQVGNDVDFAATRVSYKLNLRGPSLVVSSACSSSLVAVHLAVQSLLTGEADLALAGGVSVRFPQTRGYRWTPAGILSADGHCRVFGADADGTVEANGVAVVLLKPLDRALADGDPVHAVIKGSAVDNDAADRVGFTAPGVRGQLAVIRDALTFAEIDPRSVGYVEAHGTGTALGDPIEVRALAAVYGVGGREAPCAIGSLKSNVGHLNHVAGVAGLIKAALCLRYRRLVPSLHAGTPHRDLDLAGGALRIQTDLADWVGAGPRRAAVSSFGMGGTNAHVILEEPPSAAADPDPGGTYPLLLSARTAPALAQARARLAQSLRDDPDAPLVGVAYTLQCGRQHFRHRHVVLAHDRSAAADALIEGHGSEGWTAEQDAADRPVAFLFPGQGAQYPGMGRRLYERNPSYRRYLDECADGLRGPMGGLDLRDALHGEPAADLDQTSVTQPALFAVEYALARLWLDLGVEPAAMLGHSVGEYVAACLAGVFPLPVALALVAGRGRLLQRAPAGAMLAIGAGEPQVEERLRGHPALSLSAVNAPEQCVVGGDVAGIEALQGELASAGVPVARLRVNRAFHTAAVEPILAEFGELLGKVGFAAPTRPYLSTLTGTWIEPGEVTTPDYWVRQLREPVRFGAGIATLRRDLDPVFLEVGPGRTATGLAAAQGAADVVASEDADPAQALGRLWLAGAKVDWACGWAPRRPRRVVLPTYPFQRRRHWWSAPTPAAAQAPDPPGRLPVDRWFYQPAWREEPRPPRNVVSALRETEPRWVVVGDRAGYADGLVALLRAAGRDVVTLAPDDRQRLTDEAGRMPSAVRVVYLPGAGGGGVAAAAAAYRDLTLVVRAFAAAGVVGRVRLSVVTGPAQPVLGTEALSPAAAALAGAVTVVPQEYPGLVCEHIDVADASVPALAGELAAATGAPVALRNGRRYRRTAAPLDLTGVPLPPSRLRHEGLYVVTGGLGRLGLTLAGYLARRYAAKLVLVGRRPVPERSRWAAVTAAGGEVLAVQADVADVDQLRAAIARGREAFGRPVNGVVHAAGVTETDAFRLLSESGDADAEQHLRAKVGGAHAIAQALHGAALDGERPDFVLAFSSLAAVLGGLGFGAYAAANASLDTAVRLAARGHGTAWSTVNLDAWQGTDDGHGSAFRPAAGDPAQIRPDETDAVFDRLFRMLDIEQLYVSVTDLAGRLDRAPHPPSRVNGHAGAPPPEVPPVTPRHPRPDLPTRYRPPADGLEEAVVEIWQELLGIEPVGAEDSFFELGGHSLLAMQLVARLRSHFALEVPLRTIFQASTAAELSAEMAELFRGEGAER